ncbi:tripartite tricarboxylate transporter substrate binding protein [Alicycliphilus denitrificans]|uniref:Tripartite tricarboxylate transporter substrate binding protein n=2 Tax=Alicycliphilus denitrificans TaxID=179636 RepID=F4GGN1_ALIDK|nr:tripartite tricarboxylate transporter substrate binding protein [Alicycliphilus denitrificans]ADV01224.1 hypothetical protein Alide_3505 [Alicycliphilus denitrificans BC]AEB86256.1 hypothetical protein Alide2_3936 [Alicycliphilus denitrificans K601]QKD45367.1 tripartite tricarboxylate transporter substrate binding protein [Alicycliphilus denitrificans]GAO24848.1 hypothetical protein ALISP_4668 [Alicycliphilus sp. B1]
MPSLTTRRRFLQYAGTAATAALGAPLALAQGDAFPSRPIRIVVGYPPGQTVDSSARALAIALSDILGKPVYVENKAGANGILGAQEVRQAAPDGHTLLLGTSGQLAINPAIYSKPGYDPLKDFEPVMLNGVGRLYLVVPAASPFNSLAALVQYAKANPGKLNYGSGGRGITANLAMELLKKAAGLDILHVPYKGSSAALTDLIGGQIDVMMDAGGLVLPQVRQGKLKVLAVSSTARYKELPQVPTIAEQGYPGFEVASWTALVAPAGTPPQVVDLLNKAALKAQARPDVIKASATTGSEPSGSSPRQLREFLASENRKWAEAAQAAGVAPE